MDLLKPVNIPGYNPIRIQDLIDQLTELAWGLEMSKQRFIMVVRKPSDCAAAGYFNAGSVSDDPKPYLPEGFAKRTNRVGLVLVHGHHR
nr:hydroquinone glucosyltransferase-like [Tanacetum cinerariifolium]